MKMRTNNPSPRELDVRWSTERWTPRITFRPAGTDRRGTTLEIVPNWTILLGRKPQRRRVQVVLRPLGARPTWRQM